MPTLVDENGVFWSVTVFKKRYNKGLIARSELERELDAQYRLFEASCGHPDYWNTHENCSLCPKAFKVFSATAKKHGIIATRTFQRVYYDKINLGIKRELRELLVKCFFEIWFTRIRRDFKMPSARVVRFGKRSKLEGDYLMNALLKDGRDMIEVVVHPATTADSPYFGNISEERVNEYRLVTSREIKEKYIQHGFELVGFEEL